MDLDVVAKQVFLGCGARKTSTNVYKYRAEMGLVSIELTTSAAFVTLVIRADTAMCLLLSVVMTLVILVFPAWTKQRQFLVVHAHQVLQATGNTAKTSTIVLTTPAPTVHPALMASTITLATARKDSLEHIAKRISTIALITLAPTVHHA